MRTGLADYRTDSEAESEASSREERRDDDDGDDHDDDEEEEAAKVHDEMTR
jgi:hypothetical protein